MTADSAFKILNVDDYRAALYSRTKILRQAGYEVVEATTGRQALETVRRERPQLVLLDVNLPDITGFEVCKQIKADPDLAIIQVVHMTASSSSTADQVRGLDQGADGYLIEPLEPEVLIATVRSLERAYRAEAKVRTAALHWEQTFEAISDGVCLLDGDGHIVRANAVFARLAGTESGALAGHRLRDVIAGLDTNMGAASRVVHELEREGRWLHVRIDPIRDAGGGAEGAVCIVADVTEAKLAESARQDLLRSERVARGEAEAANRAKDEFLAVVSHELRTPLTAMLGWSSMLRPDDLATEKARRAFDVIARNTRVQAQLVDDLLDVSRIVSGKLSLEVGSVNLARVAEGALDAVRRAAVTKGIEVRTTVEGVLRPIAGDAARLQQVVSNLVANAVKFTPAGGRVDVTVRMAPNTVTIEVRDTGIGIPPERLPRIFERFNQGDSTSRRSQGGLGLGLAIVRHLTELHHGSVVAASEGPGKGATFTVTLPAAPPPAATTQVVRSGARPPEPPTEPDLTGVRVLLVDDDQDTLELFGAALAQCGASVSSAADATVALRVFEREVPDVIISDIGMPRMDGYDFIRQIRARRPEEGGRVPAIALTAYAMGVDSGRAADAGYQRHVTKPVDPLVLTRAVSDLVRG
ncbi:MAG TPA: response regulator [Patescibacteria group bacterium]|nr:response regulator [Patescibacteria group bacterium]